jgi:hypothetical protein
MAESVKKKPAGDAGEDDVQRAQTVDELEKEMLGPKAPKKPKAEKIKEPKKKKPAGKLEVAVLTSLFWLSIIGAFTLLVIFDPTPDKVIRGTTLLLINPEEETREEFHAADIFEIQDQWREIENERKALDQRDAELDLREEELNEYEDDVIAREIEVEERWITIRESGVDGVTSDVTNTANLMGRMQPRVAAQALQDMDFDTVLRVVSLISPKRLAPIFDLLEPEFLSELLSAMAAPSELEDFE